MKKCCYICWEKVDIKSKKKKKMEEEEEEEEEVRQFFWIYKNKGENFKNSRGSPLYKTNIQFTFKLV